MKVLLDEYVDRQFLREIAGHEVKTARQMGWSTVKNGELLVLAAKEFDVFVTVDRNLSFPQHIPTFDIAAIGLRGKSNRLTDLQPLLPELLASIPTAGRGVATFMGSNPTLEATRDYLNQGEADAEN